MKAIKIICILFLPITLLTNSQESRAQDSTDNFYYIQNYMQEYFENYQTENGTLDGSGYMNFKRWENFWEQRLLRTGDFNQSRIAWQDYYDQQFSSQSSQPGPCSPTTANWQPLGPTNYPTSGSMARGMGRIICIEFHPQLSNVIYAGAETGGLWKTIDGGASWFNLNTDQIPVLGVSDILIDYNNPDIIYIATGGDVAYVQGGSNHVNSIGIWKSIDGGIEWNPTAMEFNLQDAHAPQINKLLMHPANPNIMFAATNSWRAWLEDPDDWGALYKTTDGWSTFDMNADAVKKGYFWDIEFKPSDPSIIYASGKDVYKSTNNGDLNSWIKLTNIPGLNVWHLNPNKPSWDGDVGRILLAVTDDDPEYLYVAAIKHPGINLHGLWVSDDGALSFTKKNASGLTNVPGRFHFSFGVSHANKELVFIGCRYLFRSDASGGGGNIFSRRIGMHDDIQCIEFKPGNGNTMFIGTDGGVFVSYDAGLTWDPKTDGLQITQFYRLGLSASEPVSVIAGAQDNTKYLYDKTGNWKQIYSGGDGMECLIDYTTTNNEIMYVNGYYVGYHFMRTKNSGVGWANIGSYAYSLGGAPHWIPPFVLHPTDHLTLFAGFREALVSNDQGDNWIQLSDFRNDENLDRPIFVLKVAPSNPERMYVGFDEGIWVDQYNSTCTNFASTTCMWKKVLWRTDDADKTDLNDITWTDISPTVQGLGSMITSLAIHPTNPDIIWITYSGYYDNTGWQNKKVFKSTDGGDNWINYTTNDLPPLPANTIIADPLSSNEGVYLGMDAGVYYRDNTMNYWEIFDEGLPNVIVYELEIHQGTKEIYAATYGRGIWKSNIKRDWDYPNGYTIYSGVVNWDNVNLIISGDIVIKPGAVLNITNNSVIEFDEGSHIIVERGARLHIDNNSQLTSLSFCPDIMWEGIRVWGNPDKKHPTYSQVLGGYPYYPDEQGVVLLENGVIIENARNAVKTLREEIWGIDPNYYGGIIIAENSTFLNNRRAVAFMQYTKSRNVSQFKECTFELTKPLKDPSAKFLGFVSLWDVHGVKFEGNHFTGYLYLPEESRGYGILDMFASYKVIPKCVTRDPYGCCTNELPNRFNNLLKGIDHYADGSLSYSIKVTGNEFDNVSLGIISSYGGFDRISNNNFSVPVGPFLYKGNTKPTYGIYTYYALGFEVFENDFTSNYIGGGPFIDDIGIICKNSSGLSGSVYKNDFTSLNVSTQAEKNNPALEIKCNKYFTGKLDWKILGPIMDPQGQCGGDNMPAGNEFHAFCSSLSHIYKKSTSPSFTYNAHSTLIPNSTCCSAGITLYPCPQIPTGGTCPTKIGCPGSVTDPNDLRTAIINEENPDKKKLLISELVRYFLDTDTIEEAISLLESVNLLEVKKILVPTFLGRKDFAKCYQYLNQIPSVNNEDIQYHKLFDMLVGFIELGNELTDLSGAEKQIVNEVAGTATSAAIQAESILALIDDTTYLRTPEDILDTLHKTNSPFSKEDFSHLSTSDRIELYPNPANDAFTVQFNKLEFQNVKIRIFNSLGELVSKKAFDMKVHEEIFIKTNYFENGVYFVNLILDQNEEVNKRLVIMK